MPNGFHRRSFGAPRFAGMGLPHQAALGRDFQLMANVLAIPEINERRRQQAALERSLLTGLGIPEQQAQTLIPEPGFEPPGGVAGKVLSGVGNIGTVLSTLLGAPIPAPRLQMGSLVQLANLQHSRALQKKREEQFERTFGLQERRFGLAERAAERAEEAGERAERGERRLVEALEEQKEQNRIRNEANRRQEERQVEAAARSERRLQISEEGRRQSAEQFELLKKKYEEIETASEKEARQREDRLNTAKILGLDLDDPQIGWYVLTGKRLPHPDKIRMIHAELEARKQGGSAYPVLFQNVTDQQLREAWLSDKSGDLSRVIQLLDVQQRQGTIPGGGKLPDGFTFEPATP